MLLPVNQFRSSLSNFFNISKSFLSKTKTIDTFTISHVSNCKTIAATLRTSGGSSDRNQNIENRSISALTFALKLAAARQTTIANCLFSPVNWSFQSDVHGFFLDLDDCLPFLAHSEPWTRHLVSIWLIEQLGWQRAVLSRGSWDSFGRLYLPVSAFDTLKGCEFTLQFATECNHPSPQNVACCLAHHYIYNEQLQRTILYSQLSHSDLNTPSIIWVPQASWQAKVMSKFFGDLWLGYDVVFDASNEEIRIRASSEKMISTANRILDCLTTTAASLFDIINLLSLPMNLPLDVRLTSSSFSDVRSSDNISETAHVDLWIISRIFHWMDHIRTVAQNSAYISIEPITSSPFLAVEIGFLHEPWQVLLATRWLRDMLGWNLLLDDPSEPALAYHSLENLSFCQELEKFSDALPYSQLFPTRLIRRVIERELASEFSGLSWLLDSESGNRARLTHHYFQKPIAKWLRPGITAFFERSGYKVSWNSSRSVTLNSRRPIV